MCEIAFKIRPPERLGQSSESEVTDHRAMRSRQSDKSSFKCTIEANSISFKKSFFFRTLTIWNDLPVPLREVVESCDFQSNLKQHMWDVMIDPH